MYKVGIKNKISTDNKSQIKNDSPIPLYDPQGIKPPSLGCKELVSITAMKVFLWQMNI